MRAPTSSKNRSSTTLCESVLSGSHNSSSVLQSFSWKHNLHVVSPLKLTANYAWMCTTSCAESNTYSSSCVNKAELSMDRKPFLSLAVCRWVWEGEEKTYAGNSLSFLLFSGMVAARRYRLHRQPRLGLQPCSIPLVWETFGFFHIKSRSWLCDRLCHTPIVRNDLY